MKFLAALLPVFGLVAAVPTNGPSPSSVKIRGVSLLGSGCPAGTADVQVDATGTLFEATFSTYEVQTGPGTKAIDWRKNCKLTLNMEFNSGYQYVYLTSMDPSYVAYTRVGFLFSTPT